MIVRIVSGESECTLLPLAGGSIGSWNFAGQHMLRRTASETDPLASASFPLVPYSNRIANGRFQWQGATINLPPHAISLPHAIHGIGWEREWQVVVTTEDSATLRLHHQPDVHWPWPFEAEQRFEIGDDGLQITMVATNLGEGEVPLAFGHHPYFDSENASLRFEAENFYPTGADNLPQDRRGVPAEADFSRGRAVSSVALDNVFGNWGGKARIGWKGRRWALAIESDLCNAVVYTPPNADFFCFEPVPHINNALNRNDCDMPVIGPGDNFKAYIRLTAIPA